MSLNPKQAAFVREYCLDKNGAQAATRAGYSKKTARQIADRLLSKVDIRQAVDAALAKLAFQTETDGQWVRRRLKEEAEDFSEGATPSSRVRAIELIGKINGVFEKDNAQKAGVFDKVPLETLKLIEDRLRELQRPDVAGPAGSPSPSRFTH